MDSKKASLSDLCSICYAAPPKYRCPRCKTQTCSLPCYQKHQQRASCSGQRDPAAYLKKGQLATPAGLDRDFNYLKGVERRIDHAGAEVQERGIGIKSAATRNVSRGWQRDSVLQRYLTANRITVERAPVGMSRQKENRTRPSKRNRILWTVEWLEAGGRRSVRHDCAETDSVAVLYHASLAEKEGGDRKVKGVKRKRDDPGMERPIAEAKPGEDGPGQESPKVQRVPPEANDQADDSQAGDKTDDAARRQPDSPSKAEHSLEESRADTEESNPIPTEPPPNFYLLRPGTTSTAKVLIPLRSDATLTDCLQDQLVQEYPTLVVLPSAPQSLPTGFMLMEEYLRLAREEDAELSSLLRAGGGGDGATAARDSRGEERSEPLDAHSILDMLKRDVRI